MQQPRLQFKEKVIRDAVHGNIVFEPKFIRIIDTPEFQRLRRIRQVSTAFLIFPSAEHTRFSHSIGTFHVMKLIIMHFKSIFEEIGIEIPLRSIDLALSVALLHDIGHGPFSHAFEDALPKEKYKKNHEEWTIDIIRSSESHVHQALIKSFDDQFPFEVAALIKKERDIKHSRTETDPSEGINLFFILSSLISSQLDADRMDYLLRDAFFTGVTYGNYDIERLIKSLTITVNENKYYVCVHEKYLPTVEEYLVARYQMHDSVYFHPFKVQMEIMVKKILRRAYELHCSKKLETTILPPALIKLFEAQEITIEEYIKLDDALFMALFGQLEANTDKTLSLLCSAFIDRSKYQELSILNNSKKDLAEFQSELSAILNKYGYSTSDLNEEYFWISKTSQNVVYKSKKENIWVLRNNGTLADLMDISNVINENLNKDLSAAYINMEMLKLNENITDIVSAEKEIESLIYKYNNRTHIEIEKKYFFYDKNVFSTVIDLLGNWKEYEIGPSSPSVLQVDTYYDTSDNLLFNSNRTLRIRDTSGECTLTIKAPTSSSIKTEKDDRQNERFEYETSVHDCSLTSNIEYISKYIPEILSQPVFNSLGKTLEIKNNRQKIILKRNNIVFEMVFDDVSFENSTTKKTHHEYQIEIELKSEFLHRVNLKHLSDYIENNIKQIFPTTDSKYKRGLTMTN